MKNMKRILVSLLLAVCLLGTCLTASAETPAYPKMKIAWATNQNSEAFIKMQNFFNKELGPTLNIEFMYSEALSDAGAMISFIENAYINGCDGVIVDLANFIDQGAPVAQDFGMFYVGISSADAKENMDIPMYISVTGASAQGYGNSYAKAIQAAVSDGEEHAIMILSGAAPYGATSFIEGTVGSLRALQDVYGLTYDKDLHEMATSSTQVEATNDKNVKITVVPGMGDLTATVSPLLQTGEYDVVVGTTDIYSNLSVSVSEVEKATGKNIKFISRNVFSDTISTAMNGKDSTGNPVVDAIVCQGTYEHISSVLLLRNCFDGYVDQMRGEGRCSRVSGQDPLVIVSADEYNALSGDNMPYSFVPMEDIIAMTSLANPDVTWQTISDYGAALTTEAIIEKLVK